MNQKTNHVFQAENLNWNELEAVGISRQELEKNGNMELLLQGEESEVIPLKLRTPVLCITMDATLKITEGADGNPVMEINGLEREETVG